MKSKDKDTRMQGGGQISQNNSSILQNINYIMGLLCKTSWQMLKFIYIYMIQKLRELQDTENYSKIKVDILVSEIDLEVGWGMRSLEVQQNKQTLGSNGPRPDQDSWQSSVSSARETSHNKFSQSTTQMKRMINQDGNVVESTAILQTSNFIQVHKCINY